MIKVVIDANIIISGLRFGGVPRKILELINAGEITGFISDVVLEEVEEVLVTKFKVSDLELSLIREVLLENLTVITAKRLPKVPNLRDLYDLHVLAAAEICEADYVVTGDKDLLVLNEYAGIPIVAVKEIFTIIS